MGEQLRNASGLCGDCWRMTTDPTCLCLLLTRGYLHPSAHWGSLIQRVTCPICTTIEKHPSFSRNRGDSRLFRFFGISPSLSLYKGRQTSLDGSRKWLEYEEILRYLGDLEGIEVWKGSQNLMCYKFYTSEDDISGYFIPQRPINRDIGGHAALAATRLNLETCMRNHVSCRTPDKPILPYRVLDLGDPTKPSGPSVRLHSSLEAQRGEYAALSYCWGGPQSIQTTRSTIDTFSKGLDLRICSQTIQDAVVVTRGLGIQYLWIDALCIIQGQASDKMHEIASMGKIYKNATVTISAANSRSAQDGFLKYQKRGVSVQTALLCRASNQEVLPENSDLSRNGPYGKVWLELERVQDHSTEPLSQRGWAFQEQVLSLRLLQYGSEGVTWHCLDVDKTVPVMHSFVRYKPRSKASRPAILRRTGHNRRGIGYQLWSEMIEDFSNRHLTVPEDRLLAIAGIASELHELSKDTYLGGLWQEDLVRQLGWRQKEGDERATRPLSRTPSAPSWSWASVDGGIEFGGRYSAAAAGRVLPRPLPEHLYPEAILRSCIVHPRKSSAPFADIDSGRLVLSAKLIKGPHPSALKSSTADEIRAEMNITVENALVGTWHPHAEDVLDITLDQDTETGATHFSIDSRRVVRGNRIFSSAAWYLLLAYCFNESPIGLILVNDGKDRFRRIGYFQSKDPSHPPLSFNQHFKKVRTRDVVIV